MAIRLVPALVLVAATSSWFASKVSTRAAATVESPAPAGDDTPRQQLIDWLRARLPPGGRVDDTAERGLEVVHTAAAGETALTIAKAHVHLTDVYRATDLAALIAREQAAIRPGVEVRIPHLVAAPPPGPDEDRMRWPTDRVLKGIYITGETAGMSWPETVDRVKAHGLNAIVVDAPTWRKARSQPVRQPVPQRVTARRGRGLDGSSRPGAHLRREPGRRRRDQDECGDDPNRHSIL